MPNFEPSNFENFEMDYPSWMFMDGKYVGKHAVGKNEKLETFKLKSSK